MDMQHAWEIVNLSQTAFDAATITAQNDGLDKPNGWVFRLREVVWGNEYKARTSYNPADGMKDRFGAWRQAVDDEFRSIDGICSNVTIRYAGNGSIKVTEMFVSIDRRERLIWSRRGPGFLLDGPWWSDAERIANAAEERVKVELDRMRNDANDRRLLEKRAQEELAAKWQMRQFKDIAT